MALKDGRTDAIDCIKVVFGYDDADSGDPQDTVENIATEIVDALITLMKEGDIKINAAPGTNGKVSDTLKMK